VTVATAALSLGIFAIALRLSGIVGVSADVLSTTRNTVAIIRDSTLDDTTRESAVSAHLRQPHGPVARPVDGKMRTNRG